MLKYNGFFLNFCILHTFFRIFASMFASFFVINELNDFCLVFLTVFLNFCILHTFFRIFASMFKMNASVHHCVLCIFVCTHTSLQHIQYQTLIDSKVFNPDSRFIFARLLWKYLQYLIIVVEIVNC